MPAERYSDEQIDAAIEAIAHPEVFREAERQVARAAPKLQNILAEALNAGYHFAYVIGAGLVGVAILVLARVLRSDPQASAAEAPAQHAEDELATGRACADAA